MKFRLQTLMTLMVLSLGVLTTACNTVAGAGKDIERGGEHIQNATH